MKIEEFLERHMTVVSKSGDEWCCMCVFHDDGSNASMYVNVRKRVFLCHACGAKGTVQRLERMYGNGLIDKRLSTEQIRERIRAVQNATREPVRTFPDAWLERFTTPTDYWRKRGLADHTVKLFNLGYDPIPHAAIIPLRDSYGSVIGVIRRYLDERYVPRYMYPKGFQLSRYLFGAWLVRHGSEREVVLTEGSIDAMKVWNAGITALALLGSRISDAQVRLLKEIGVSSAILMLDNDRAGEAGALQVREALLSSGFIVKRAVYPHAQVKDPGDLSSEAIQQMHAEAHQWMHVDVSSPCA